MINLIADEAVIQRQRLQQLGSAQGSALGSGRLSARKPIKREKKLSDAQKLILLAHDPGSSKKDEPVGWETTAFHEQKKNVTFSNGPTKKKVAAPIFLNKDWNFLELEKVRVVNVESNIFECCESDLKSELEKERTKLFER